MTEESLNCLGKTPELKDKLTMLVMVGRSAGRHFFRRELSRYRIGNLSLVRGFSIGGGTRGPGAHQAPQPYGWGAPIAQGHPKVGTQFIGKKCYFACNSSEIKQLSMMNV